MMYLHGLVSVLSALRAPGRSLTEHSKVLRASPAFHPPVWLLLTPAAGAQSAFFHPGNISLLFHNSICPFPLSGLRLLPQTPSKMWHLGKTTETTTPKHLRAALSSHQHTIITSCKSQLKQCLKNAAQLPTGQSEGSFDHPQLKRFLAVTGVL